MSRLSFTCVTTACILCVLSFGCSPTDDELSSGGTAAVSGGSVKLTGSGASFPDPLYQRWFKEYCSSHPGVKVDYQYDDPQKVETLKDLVQYCLTEGQKVSDEMGYVPLPESVVTKVTHALDNIK